MKTCKICGRESSNEHMKQYHPILAEYNTGAYESTRRSELTSQIKKLEKFIQFASIENPMNMGDDKNKLEALKNELASLGEGGPGSGPQKGGATRKGDDEYEASGIKIPSKYDPNQTEEERNKEDAEYVKNATVDKLKRRLSTASKYQKKLINDELKSRGESYASEAGGYCNKCGIYSYSSMTSHMKDRHPEVPRAYWKTLEYFGSTVHGDDKFIGDDIAQKYYDNTGELEMAMGWAQKEDGWSSDFDKSGIPANPYYSLTHGESLKKSNENMEDLELSGGEWTFTGANDSEIKCNTCGKTFFVGSYPRSGIDYVEREAQNHEMSHYELDALFNISGMSGVSDGSCKSCGEIPENDDFEGHKRKHGWESYSSEMGDVLINDTPYGFMNGRNDDEMGDWTTLYGNSYTDGNRTIVDVPDQNEKWFTDVLEQEGYDWIEDQGYYGYKEFEKGGKYYDPSKEPPWNDDDIERPQTYSYRGESYASESDIMEWITLWNDPEPTTGKLRSFLKSKGYHDEEIDSVISQHDLKSHFGESKATEGSVSCPNCDKSFDSVDALLRHMTVFEQLNYSDAVKMLMEEGIITEAYTRESKANEVPFSGWLEDAKGDRTESAVYTCPYCSEQLDGSFNIIGKARDHLMTKHGYSEDRSDEIIQKEWDIYGFPNSIYESMTEVTCDICGDKFNEEAELADHYEAHDIRDFKDEM